MTPPESRRHHFVPKLLLRPWLLSGSQGQQVLRGYYWDHRRGDLRAKERGLDSFCFQMDLLTLRAHQLGRDAIERVFFGEVDRRGANVRDRLLAVGAEALTLEERCDFVRLLLSLEARRPINVANVRAQARALREGLNTDPAVVASAVDSGLTEPAADFFENWTGVSIEDRILGIVQKLTDNPKVGGRIVAAPWHIKRLRPEDGLFVLGDRPLIRFHAYDAPGGTWVMPLDPVTAFISGNHLANLDRLRQLPSARFCRLTNVSSASQTERFAFSVDNRDAKWLPKYLRKSVAAPAAVPPAASLNPSL